MKQATFSSSARWSATTNRTILELKQQKDLLIEIAQDYQSHHTGIETGKRRVSFYLGKPTNRTILELKLESYMDSIEDNLCYQSHHTGIETGFGCGLYAVGWVYQSHHTGIETAFATTFRMKIFMTTNRTILELKQPST